MAGQTVFVVDDDAVVRDSIRELLESVGLPARSFASAQEFLDAFRPERTGCLVLDVRMAGMSGLVLQDELKERGISLPIIVLTGHGDVPMAVRALQAGAVDFIQKPYRDQQLLDAINRALAADAAASRTAAETDTFDRQIASLTAREQEVLEKLWEGLSSKEIAAELGISHRTVEAHRQNLLHKLEIGSVRELMARHPGRNKGE